MTQHLLAVRGLAPLRFHGSCFYFCDSRQLIFYVNNDIFNNTLFGMRPVITETSSGDDWGRKRLCSREKQRPQVIGKLFARLKNMRISAYFVFSSMILPPDSRAILLFSR
jgi:hypothetical protein